MTASASSHPLPASGPASTPAPRLTADQQRRLARLRPTDWLVLLLRQQGWRVGAIATALGVSPGRIAQRLHRARFALEVPRSTQALLAAVPWQQCPTEAQAAFERLLARWRQGPPPATPWGLSRVQRRRADEPAHPDGGARHATS
ncbi:MAG: sigma-70 family RNA polymerase sigma factor [Thermogemmatispora sp.]|uniref:sigma factor-like helix-turn-helix DNA-binding protein n=1 Tax=Thermogemmatispora sp. TaxID=1968838 RepID=UPI001A0BA2A9|nr:sigma factor-like helix-turn-helix DNA-binding protein [Thermogemmatispora sp.]MBE3568192.1 sigma-70 family RNA polymerase sigma factor [Thermogemmatispora sp.]